VAARNLVFTILGIDKGSKAFDQVGQAADRASDRLDGFGKVGAKVLTAMPLAAAGAGVATAGALALVGAGVIGLSAVILHNNEQVAQSASALAETVREGAKQAAEPLADDLAGAMDRLRGLARDLQPEFARMFVAAQPGIEHLTNGVILFTRNAMPGLVTAVQSSGPVFRGMESAMADVGTGVTRFFTNASRGAESAGQIFASFGRIARDGLGFVGSLLAQLSNTGAPAVATLEGFLHKLETTVLNLASGAFPALMTSASGFLAVGSGILSILNALSPVLGPLIGHLGAFAVALKLVNAVSFGQVGAAFAALKTQIGEAQGAGGKFKAGLTGLMSSGLLPLGVAAAGLGLILTGLGTAQQRAARDAAAHESRISTLTGALRESNGAITSNVRALAAKSLSEQEVGRTGRNVLQVARESGVSLDTLTDAYLGNADAQKVVNDQLTAFIKSRAVEGTAMDEVASRANELRNDVLPGLNGEYATSAQRAKDLAAATGDAAKAVQQLTPAQQAAKAEAEKIKTSFTTLGDSMKTVAEKGQAVLDILDRMSGKAPDLREAEQAWNDLARTMTKDTDWNSSIDGVQKLGDSLVNMQGEVNTTTEAGSKLQDWAQQSATAFANNAAAMKAAGVPADEMSKKLGVMRQQFIDNAIAQGLPRAAAERLAQAYHLVPDIVSTLVITPNLAQKMQEMGMFAHQVRNLPDGAVVVTSNVDPARNSVTKLIQDINGRVATIRVTAVGTAREMVRNARGGMAAMSEGGWVRGTGTTTSDSNPRMLSRDEFVVRASKAKRYASVLEAINTGRGPGQMVTPGGGSFMPMSAPTGGVARVVFDFTGIDGAASRFLVDLLRGAIRKEGGDVQLVLGGRS